MSKFKPWKTYSIFISSTFADMQAERDHLKNIVLPRIKEELRKKRIKLEIVDLRWGLDTTSIEQEDEREVTVLKVCLDEIKRCKPFFICLMGDRYGWIPPEKRMDDATIGMNHISHHKGKSVTALEIEFGVLASQKQLVRSVFYFRDTLDYTKFSPERAAMFSDVHNPDLSEKEKKERGKALKKLKSSIISHFDKKKLKDKVKSYTVNWEARKEKVINLEAWGDMVYEDIINDCIAHAKYTKTSAPKNWQEKELALLDSFIENHTTTFCGREKLLEKLKEHLLLKDPNNRGLILTGESGSGKSAVFSMINKIMQQEDCFILSHSAGLSAKSRNIIDLLQIWNKQLSDFLGIEYIELKPHVKTVTLDNLQPDNEGIQQTEPKPEIEKVQDKFKELLFTVAEQIQVVLLIDALDRFEPTQRAQYMTWLPTIMPRNIRMLYTAITGTEKKAIEYHSELLVKSIDFFTSEEAKLMLNMLCNLQHKSIPVKVEKVILEKKRDDGLVATSSPLWLSLAVNILMAMDNDDFEKMQQLEGRGDEVIVDYMETLAEDFPALPGSLFLSLLTKAASIFGEGFTWKTFNYIACSRDGLRESDLEKLIPKTKYENWDALLFANLRRWFNKHLREEGEDKQWNLVHSILRNSLLKEIKKEATTSIHNSIASHLLTLPTEDELRISETMYHFMEAENTKGALDYYISDLTDEEIDGATMVLAEAISTSEKGIDWILSLIDAADTDSEQILKLSTRFIYNLNDTLTVEGNLSSRIRIFKELEIVLRNTDINFKNNAYFGYILLSLFEKLGTIYKTNGQTDNALQSFKNYSTLAKDIYDNNPQNNDNINHLAISHEKLGEIYQLIGRLDQALKYFNGFSSMTKELLENNPKNNTYKNNYASSFDKLGEVYMAKGQSDNALQCYKNSNNLISNLYKSNPNDEYYKSNLATSFDKLGDFSQANGNLNQALEYFHTFSTLFEELHKSNPKNENYKKGLALSFFKAGAVYQESQQLEESLVFFNKYYILTKELYENNPEDINHKNNFAISHERLGEIYLALNEYNQALRYLLVRNNLAKEISDSNPENVSFKSSLITSYEKLGIVYKAMGEIEQALQFYLLKNNLAKKLFDSNSNNVNIAYLLGGSHYEIGIIHVEMEQHAKAKTHFTSALYIFEQVYKATQQEIYNKDCNQARDIIQQLERAGY